jgi:hypothetical protein
MGERERGYLHPENAAVLTKEREERRRQRERERMREITFLNPTTVQRLPKSTAVLGNYLPYQDVTLDQAANHHLLRSK